MQKLLDWLSDNLWMMTPWNDISEATKSFYQTKTTARLAAFREANTGWQEPKTIMGKAVPTIDELLALVPWDTICRGEASFIHGDLQFGNIIYTETSFKLIDWRQDFAGSLDVGDLAYDFAKMIAGIRVDFSALKEGSYFYNEANGNAVLQTWPMNNSTEIEQMIFDRAEEYGITRRRLELLIGIVYLNMAGVHSVPLSRLLHGLAVKQLAGILIPI